MTRLILTSLLVGTCLMLTGCLRDNSPEPADALLSAEEEIGEDAADVIISESEVQMDREKKEMSHEEAQEIVRKRLEELEESVEE